MGRNSLCSRSGRSVKGDRKMIKARTRLMLLAGVCTLLIALVACDTPSTQPANITPLALTPGTTNTPSPVPSSDWTTYHHDNARTGSVANVLDPRQLTHAWSAQLDGAVYAEPLVIGGRVIVATEGDSLYALDRNTGQAL